MKQSKLKKLIKEQIQKLQEQKPYLGPTPPSTSPVPPTPGKGTIPAYVCKKCGGATEISLPNLLDFIQGNSAFFPCSSPSQNEICEAAWDDLNPGVSTWDVEIIEPGNWIIYNPSASDINPSVEEWGDQYCNIPVDTQGASVEDFCIKCAAESWPQEILDGECVEIQDCCPGSGGTSLTPNKKKLQERLQKLAGIKKRG